jgi:hypothetical protein
MIEELEKKFGFKVDELSPAEKETFFKMLENVSKAAMTPEKMRDYISLMRESVEKQIVKEQTFIRIFLFKVENPNLIRLQARLENYLLLEAFLVSPKKAKDMLEEAISNVKAI